MSSDFAQYPFPFVEAVLGLHQPSFQSLSSGDATLRIVALASSWLMPPARDSGVRDHGPSSGAFAKPSPYRYH